MKKTMRKLGALMLALALVLSGISIVGPAVTGTDTVYAATEKTEMYVKVQKLKAYSKRSENSKVRKTLQLCDTVTMLGSADSNGWVKIEYAKDKRGFVQKSKLGAVDAVMATFLKDRSAILKAAKNNRWKLNDAELKRWKNQNGVNCTRLYYYFSNDSYSFSFFCDGNDRADLVGFIIYEEAYVVPNSGKTIKITDELGFSRAIGVNHIIGALEEYGN